MDSELQDYLQRILLILAVYRRKTELSRLAKANPTDFLMTKTRYDRKRD